VDKSGQETLTLTRTHFLHFRSDPPATPDRFQLTLIRRQPCLAGSPRTGAAMTQTEGISSHPAEKAIVLFSDETGSSSAKLFKTNVWRMYEAMELDSGARQIAFYDNDVGLPD
jgi:uncharacterized protein (DUF2235 family)